MTTTSTSSTTVDYGTAIRATRIRPPTDPRASLALWTRTAPHRDHPFSSVPVRSAPTGPSGRFVTGDGDDVVRTYRLPAEETLAATALHGDSGSVDWLATYRDWGTLLAALHATDVDDTQRTEPPARTRLRDWWSRPDLGDARRSAGRAAFLDGLSARARDHLDDVLGVDPSPDGVLVHGWAGVGHSVADPDGRLVVMVGEDVGHAPPEYDLGALTAQAVELAVFSPAGRAPSPTEVRDELLRGYAEHGGRPIDDDRLADHTIEHVVRHVADFTWFADYADTELPRWSSLVDWLESNRAP